VGKTLNRLPEFNNEKLGMKMKRLRPTNQRPSKRDKRPRKANLELEKDKDEDLGINLHIIIKWTMRNEKSLRVIRFC